MVYPPWVISNVHGVMCSRQAGDVAEMQHYIYWYRWVVISDSHEFGVILCNVRDSIQEKFHFGKGILDTMHVVHFLAYMLDRECLLLSATVSSSIRKPSKQCNSF